jgi:poly(A) polymerase
MEAEQSPPAAASVLPSASPQPRIIARADHGISRRQISPAALKVLYRLNEAGFEAYLVGGAVRDLLLGGAPKDFDVATNATPEQVRALFRNCRLIGRRFRLAHVIFGPEIIEVATFRAQHADDDGDREFVDGRLVRDNVWGGQHDDALRRDFTVNALFYGVHDFAVRDFVGGMEDLRARRLRLIGEPEQRYREDPVRMLRAVRLAAKLEFELDAATAEPITRLAPLLHDVPAARLFDEVLKLFLTGHGVASFLGLERADLWRYLFPASARAIAAAPDAGLRALVLRALGSTDARVREDRPVTPAFLFAALLWPAYLACRAHWIERGADAAQAHDQAAEEVIREQVRLVALPKRFSVPMQEIWSLQWRFEQRSRKRVLRLLAHPRFRAGYDFLALRREESAGTAELAAWWEAAQGAGDSDLDDLLAGTGQAEPMRKRRRRRRGGRRRARGGDGGRGGGGGGAAE